MKRRRTGHGTLQTAAVKEGIAADGAVPCALWRCFAWRLRWRPLRVVKAAIEVVGLERRSSYSLLPLLLRLLRRWARGGGGGSELPSACAPLRQLTRMAGTRAAALAVGLTRQPSWLRPLPRSAAPAAAAPSLLSGG
ncbi:hypothetical protein Tsubulata_028270 [Turnera subulata]|uniref:Uncharacterized protein n=1 Tax=Turnera subulata TaxID=218843 RepID=A0A9Q0J3S2_9ROSI|nr:hypothetical protein Tsubulata_028270 [Turnera subulata]